MGNQEDIRKLLREKFEHFEPQPERDIWAGIERVVRPQPWYRKIGWYGYASAAVVLLLLALGISFTDVLYRQPSPGGRRVAASGPEILHPDSLSIVEDQQLTLVQERLPVDVQQEMQEAKAQDRLSMRSITTGEQIKNQPDTSEPEGGESGVPQLNENRPVALLAIHHVRAEIPAIGLEPGAEDLRTISPVPLADMAGNEMSGSRKQIDLADVSLADALVVAGNGLKKLTQRPEHILESEDGTETTRTYRINFLDISISKRTHTFKSSKEET